MHCREVAGLCNDVWWVNSIIFCIQKNIEFIPVGTALETLTLTVTSGVTIVALATLTIAAPGRVRGALSRGRGPV